MNNRPFLHQGCFSVRDYLKYRWQTVIENVVFSKSSSSKSSFEKWKSCDNSGFWGRGQPSLSLPLSHFDSHSLSLSISLSLSLSLPLSHVHAQAVTQALAHLSPPLSGRPAFLCFSPTPHPKSHSHFQPPAAPTHPHLAHPLLPLPPLTLQKRGVIFRAQLTV